MSSVSSAAAPTLAESLREYGRGVLGGLLVSLPLLYTMEMWWAGFVLSPLRLLGGLAATFALLLLYNRYAGLRASSSWGEIAIDSVEELGLGLVVSTLVLWLVGAIGGDVPAGEALGKVVVEACFVAIGVSVGTAQLGSSSSEGGMAGESDATASRSPLAGDLALALCGGVLVGANVAPTDEIVDIAARATGAQLAGLMALGLALSVGAVAAEQSGPSGRGTLAVVREGVMCYAMALLAGAALLAFFGRFDGASLPAAASLVAVLGLPTALGAGAGRLLVEGPSGDGKSGDGESDAQAASSSPASA